MEAVSPLGAVKRVSNIYVLTESVSGECEDALERLRIFGNEECWLMCSDLNGNHSARDRHVPANARGVQVMRWSDERYLVLVSDGSVMRRGRGTDCTSAPDVTFCSPQVLEFAVGGGTGTGFELFSHLHPG